MDRPSFIGSGPTSAAMVVMTVRPMAMSFLMQRPFIAGPITRAVEGR
ncbi:hypothetical protein [Inquilinus limosus]|nr:hypothetical protein [Inquilinus limosus]